MANFRDIVNYFRPYWGISILSIGAASIFEIIDLIAPYAIGQILNVLSGQALDQPWKSWVEIVATLTQSPVNPFLSLAVLLGIICIVTVVRAPIQPWVSSWFHWEIPLRARRDQLEKAIEKILTLPLDFYDEHNPGRIATRVAKGIANHTWTYPEIAGQLIPKLARVLGIFVIIWFIEWWIALVFLISFVFILGFGLRDLKKLISEEEILYRYQENT